MTHAEYVKRLSEIEQKRHDQMTHVKNEPHYNAIVKESRQAIATLNRQYIDSAWKGLNKTNGQS